jgi:AIPR protein
MINETPIEILELPAQLRTLFTGKVPEATSGIPEAKERNFLSRSLAAYAIHKLAKCNLDDAADSVVDGGDDGGIDAIFYAADDATFFVVQSKYIAKGCGEPDLGEVTKFKTGLENLLQGKFEAFSKNEAWNKRLPQITTQLSDAEQVHVVLVYSGIHTVSEDRLRLFEDLRQRFSADDDFIEVQFCNLTTVHDWLTGADLTIGVDRVDLTLLNPGCWQKPHKTVFGLLPLSDLASLYAQHGKQLVAANIRAYKGSTKVNDRIVKTIEKEPENFFYLNNGLTAYCDRLEVNNYDRGCAESKRVTAYGLSIVNGAQTLGSVAEYFKNSPDSNVEGHVFIKVISLERCEDDRAFAAQIARSTNFQNQIGSQDFAALDEQQSRIAKELVLSGITYHYKSDINTPPPDETNFSFQEATTACACLAKTSDLGDFCALILLDTDSLDTDSLDSLTSMEEIYPAKEVLRSRYSRVFRADRSARTVWRAVQIQRLVMRVMQQGSTTGDRKQFFRNARWVLLSAIFIKLQLAHGQDLQLTNDEANLVTQSATKFSEELWMEFEIECGGAQAGTGWKNFVAWPYFFDKEKCDELRNRLLARLART